MRKLVISVFAIGSLLVASAANPAAKDACKFSDVAKLKEHLEKHVTYPAKGKDIKEACKKEMPDEFTAQERSCVDSKLKSDTEYRNAGDVMKALGVKS